MCEIRITDIAVVESETGLVITVHGEVEDCPQLLVEIACSGGTSTQTVAVTSRTFTATFDEAAASASGCDCGDDVTVTVTCATDRSCSDERTTRIVCEGDDGGPPVEDPCQTAACQQALGLLILARASYDIACDRYNDAHDAWVAAKNLVHKATAALLSVGAVSLFGGLLVAATGLAFLIPVAFVAAGLVGILGMVLLPIALIARKLTKGARKRALKALAAAAAAVMAAIGVVQAQCPQECWPDLTPPSCEEV